MKIEDGSILSNIVACLSATNEQSNNEAKILAEALRKDEREIVINLLERTVEHYK
jgi:hypothetical protein